jgi:hypothetical protein
MKNSAGFKDESEGDTSARFAFPFAIGWIFQVEKRRKFFTSKANN